MEKNKKGGKIHKNLIEFLVELPNRMAYESALQLVQNASSEYNPLVFLGPPKSGKSHLLQAICKGIKEKSSDCSVLYLSGDEFCRSYYQSLRQKDYQQFRKSCRDCDYFFLDGLQFLSNQKSAQKELLFTIDKLLQTSSQMVFSSTPLDLSDFSPALINRMKNGLSVKLHPLSDEKVLEYCKERAQDYKIKIDEEIILSLWKKFPGNFGDFKIMLHKIYRFLGDQKQKITMSMAREWIENYQKRYPSAITFEKILAAVADHYQITDPQALSQKNGSRHLVIPRYVAIALTRESLKMNMQQLREHFGRLSPSAIRHALKKVAGDSALYTIVQELRRRLQKPQ